MVDGLFLGSTATHGYVLSNRAMNDLVNRSVKIGSRISNLMRRCLRLHSNLMKTNGFMESTTTCSSTFYLFLLASCSSFCHSTTAWWHQYYNTFSFILIFKQNNKFGPISINIHYVSWFPLQHVVHSPNQQFKLDENNFLKKKNDIFCNSGGKLQFLQLLL